MAKVRNQVIAGDYLGCDVGISFRGEKKAAIILNQAQNEYLWLDKTTVEFYQLVDESSRVSATSAVGRAAIGGFLLGPVGLAAGLSAKRKGIYTLALQFKDGKKSLVEIDDSFYKAIIEHCF